MSKNNEQRNLMKGLKDSLLELQILRFFTTLAILTIIFVLVLRFVQQTSVTSDKIKPVEASFGAVSIDALIEIAPSKTQTHLNKSIVDSTSESMNSR